LGSGLNGSRVGSAGDYISGEIDEAKDYAAAEAELKAAEAQAAAEQAAAGMVSAETQARIAEAAANLAAAKSHADSAASSAESTAKTYASTLLQSMADGTYTGGTFIDGKSIMSPTVVGLQGTLRRVDGRRPLRRTAGAGRERRGAVFNFLRCQREALVDTQR